NIHMDGSCLAAMLKIAFVFGVFDMDFTGIGRYTTAIGICLLSGIVMSCIPGGGFMGELMLITLFGLLIEALPIIITLGVLFVQPATMINVTVESVSSMLVTRNLEGKDWMKTTAE